MGKKRKVPQGKLMQKPKTTNILGVPIEEENGTNQVTTGMDTRSHNSFLAQNLVIHPKTATNSVTQIGPSDRTMKINELLQFIKQEREP